jgi:hypothetical protein
MSDENPQSEIDEAAKDADEELGELEDKADDMGERLEEHESDAKEVDVPEPDQGEAADEAGQ